MTLKRTLSPFKLIISFVLCCVLLTVTAFASNGSTSYNKLLKSIEPKTESFVIAGETVTLRALALDDTTVKATIDKTTVTLSRTSTRSGDYYWYEGSYTVPSVSANTKVGPITITATQGSRSESMSGAGFTVVDIDTEAETPTTAAQGQQIQVTAQYADVFIDADRGEDYAAPYYYELPAGTIDYVKSKNATTYLLVSGRKVLISDVKTLSSSASKGDNTIASVDAQSKDGYTVLTIDQTWPVPFNVETETINYKSSSSNTVTSYNATKVILTFDYTDGFDFSKISLPSSGMFSSASLSTRVKNGIKQAVITLTLRENQYYGCYSEYNGSTLTLRFLNPVDDLSGLRVVIDPGHGQNGGVNVDVGTSRDGYYESDLNLKKAKAIRDELESRGATVYMLDSHNTDLKDLYTRVDLAIDWEPHIYLSVHHNSTSAVTTSARGVEVYYNTPYSQPLAEALSQSIYGAYQKMDYGSGALNRGGKFSEFAVTRTKQFVAVLVEFGFMNNPNELSVLADDDNLPLFAEATADAIEAFISGK